VNCSPVPTTKPWKGYKECETMHDIMNPRRRVRGPGLQPRVGRVPSRGVTFDAVYIVGTRAGGLRKGKVERNAGSDCGFAIPKGIPLGFSFGISERHYPKPRLLV